MESDYLADLVYSVKKDTQNNSLRINQICSEVSDIKSLLSDIKKLLAESAEKKSN